MQNRPPITRKPFPADVVGIAGSVPFEKIPLTTRGRSHPAAPRRWEKFGEQIRANTERGEATILTVPKGYDPDIVRSGIASELNRFDLTAQFTSVAEDDGTMRLYASAVPRRPKRAKKEGGNGDNSE